MRCYLDYNASAPMIKEVKNYIVKILDKIGNPSSIHSSGREVKKILENSRKNVAKLINCEKKNLIFTSGATEANNLALNGYSTKIISTVEHESIKNQKNTLEVEVNSDGYIDLEKLENVAKYYNSKKGVIISVMFANNETGIIQPIEKIMSISKKYNLPFHTDAVQAIGRVSINFEKLGIDMMTLSSHKIGGPNGAGALAVSSKNVVLAPLFLGGQQEDSLRSGTEPYLSIAGFGVAALNVNIKKMINLKIIREEFEKNLKKANLGIKIVGENSNRLPNTFMMYVPKISAENLLMALDLEGFDLSTGSACSSGKVEPSKVLMSMGFAEEEALSSVRVSLGIYNSIKESENFVIAIKKIMNRFREV